MSQRSLQYLDVFCCLLQGPVCLSDAEYRRKMNEEMGKEEKRADDPIGSYHKR